MPWYLRRLFATAYHVGGGRGELTSIQWAQLDFGSNQIRLHGTETKNEEPQTLPIYGEMREWLLIAKEIREEKFPNCPWVFYTEEGQRLYWFYKAWEAACNRAGVPDLSFHDLRRSAVRNMERAGVPRKVAMSISGHKTEHVYRRYDIRDARDLVDAAARMDQYFGSIKQPDRARTGTISGTVQDQTFPESSKLDLKLLN